MRITTPNFVIFGSTLTFGTVKSLDFPYPSRFEKNSEIRKTDATECPKPPKMDTAYREFADHISDR